MARANTTSERIQWPPEGTPLKAHEWACLGEESRKWVIRAASHLAKDSHNSSQPPSLDNPKAKTETNLKRSERRRRGKKRRPGGQPGHPGHQRALVPPERVDVHVEHLPRACRRCARDLDGLDPDAEPLHHQIAELPEIRPVVTDHVCHRVTCPDCETTTVAEPPEGVPKGCFGPNLRALVVLLSGRYRISRRETADLCKSVFGLSVSVGSIANILDRASDALAAPYEEVAAAAKNAPVAYMDETGWRQKGKAIHLWILATTLCVLFRIGRRTKGVAQELLGEGYVGWLVTDRYAAYRWVPDDRHQVCWAHLIRDFKGLIDRGGTARRIGRSMRKISDDLFSIWHAYKEGRISRARMTQQMADVEVRAGAVLAEGMRCRNAEAKRLCTSLSKIEKSLFVFARTEGVEPTNNTGERGIRPAVQWRKICFGTQSDRGSGFVERILTVAATCRVQDRPLLPYLREVLAAADAGRKAPSLVASGPTAQAKSTHRQGRQRRQAG